MRFETRKSPKAVHGESPALRPKLPSREARPAGPIIPFQARQGSWKIPVGEYFEWTTGFPSAVHAGVSNVFGRGVLDSNCKLSSTPVMMLNGRPEEISTSGANVQSLKSLLAKPPPASLPVWYTPLKTNRWR